MQAGAHSDHKAHVDQTVETSKEAQVMNVQVAPASRSEKSGSGNCYTRNCYETITTRKQGTGAISETVFDVCDKVCQKSDLR
jgi:hypothetical protein